MLVAQSFYSLRVHPAERTSRHNARFVNQNAQQQQCHSNSCNQVWVLNLYQEKLLQKQPAAYFA